MRKFGLSLLLIFVLTLLCAGDVIAQAGPGESPLLTPTATVTPPGGETPPTVELSGAGIAAIVAVITSVLLAYVPGLATWWGLFTYKRESLGGVGLVIAVCMVGLHYAGAINLGIGDFGWPVVWRTIEAWLAFSGAGQLAFTAQKALSQEEDE